MDLALYASFILLYAGGLVWFSLRIARRKRRRALPADGLEPVAAERGDLIDPTALFRYREEEQEIDRLFAAAPKKRATCDGVSLGPIDLPAEEDGEAQAVRDLLLAVDERSAGAVSGAPPARARAEACESFDPAHVEEFVINELLKDSFGALLEFLKGADEATCAAHLPRLFEFRDDERFLFAVSEMLAHRSPLVQESCRALVEKSGDAALLDELIDLSMNQSYLEVARTDTPVDAEWEGLSRDEKIARLERETDPDRALAIAGELAEDRDPRALAVVTRVAERILSPAPAGERQVRRRGATMPVSTGGVGEFRKQMTIARIGAKFRLRDGEELLRARERDYERHNLDADLFEAAREPNEFVRGKALLRMGRTLLTAKAVLALRERLSDGSAHVRACAAEALSLFARRARDRGLLEGTREVRQMLLTAMLAESDRDAAARIERALYDIERGPGMPDLVPLSAAPERMAQRFAMKRIPLAEPKRLIAKSA